MISMGDDLFLTKSNNYKFSSLPEGFELIDGFIVRKHATLFDNRFQEFKYLINNLIENPNSNVVKIYNFQYSGIVNHYGTKRHKYYYDMQKLYPITYEESKIVDSSYTNLGSEWELDCPILIKGNQTHPALMKFLHNVIWKLKYIDLHDGNVMKNKDGDYKIIDLEGFLGV